MLRTPAEETLSLSEWLLGVGMDMSFCSLSGILRATKTFLGPVLWCYSISCPILQTPMLGIYLEQHNRLLHDKRSPACFPPATGH
jgi:hypothetical protein